MRIRRIYKNLYNIRVNLTLILHNLYTAATILTILFYFWFYRCKKIAIDDEDKKEAVVTTRKLICWSFQIARGMEYLGSKKVNELSNSIVKKASDWTFKSEVPKKRSHFGF